MVGVQGVDWEHQVSHDHQQVHDTQGRQEGVENVSNLPANDFKFEIVDTAQLNLNSSWEWQSSQLDHPPTTTPHLNF